MDNGENVKDFYSSQQGDTLHIPCKPTHPNATVSLSLVRQWASKEWAEDISKVIQRQSFQMKTMSLAKTFQ